MPYDQFNQILEEFEQKFQDLEKQLSKKNDQCVRFSKAFDELRDIQKKLENEVQMRQEENQLMNQEMEE